MTKKRILHNEAGFTLMEMLIAVGILVIISLVVFINVLNYQRGMKQLELDKTAREIFVAAQNHLTVAQGVGTLATRGKGTDGKDLTGDALQKALGESATSVDKDGKNVTYHYFYVTPENASELLNKSSRSVLYDMLPDLSIDDTVRKGGSYAIEYELDTATVTNVFYSDQSNLSNVQFGSADREKLFARDGGAGYWGTDTENPGAPKKRLDGYNSDSNKMIGWYGGEDAINMSRAKLFAPKVEVKNEECLTVKVSFPFQTLNQMTDNTDADPILQLTIVGLKSGNEKVINASSSLGDGSVGEKLSKFNADADTESDGSNTTRYKTYVLDDITQNGKHFNDLWCTGENALIPGEDIKVVAKVFSQTALSNIPVAESGKTNSIFAEVKPIADDPTKNKAMIANFRHLENLSKAISNYDPSKLENGPTSAEQTKDLMWAGDESKTSTAFLYRVMQIFKNDKSLVRTETEANKLKVYYGDGNSTKEGMYAPVDPSFALSYDGANKKMSNVTIDCTGDAGVFGKIKEKDSSIKDLELLDCSVTTSGGHAGMLLGMAESSIAISNVLAHHAVGGTATNLGVKATGNSAAVGGLVGLLATSGLGVSTKVDGSAAAVIVQATGFGSAAGGLVGGTDGSVAITNSYAGGHTEEGVYNLENPNVTSTLIVGGLVGSMSGSSSIDHCYATTSVSAGSMEGGLVGTAAGGSITNSYATGSIKDAVGQTYRGGIVGYVNTLTATSFTNNRWFASSVANAVGNDASANNRTEEFAAIDGSFLPEEAARADAVPYDSKVVELYSNKYEYPTIRQLYAEGASNMPAETKITTTHYGDWQAVQDTPKVTLTDVNAENHYVIVTDEDYNVSSDNEKKYGSEGLITLQFDTIDKNGQAITYTRELHPEAAYNARLNNKNASDPTRDFETSQFCKAVNEAYENDEGEQKTRRRYYVLIDSITTNYEQSQGGHAVSRFANMQPGANIDITVFKRTGTGLVQSTEPLTTNSLFERIDASDEGEPYYTAVITNARHLQNLDSRISGLNNKTVALKIDGMKLEKDIAWENVFDRSGEQEHFFHADGTEVRCFWDGVSGCINDFIPDTLSEADRSAFADQFANWEQDKLRRSSSQDNKYLQSAAYPIDLLNEKMADTNVGQFVADGGSHRIINYTMGGKAGNEGGDPHQHVGLFQQPGERDRNPKRSVDKYLVMTISDLYLVNPNSDDGGMPKIFIGGFMAMNYVNLTISRCGIYMSSADQYWMGSTNLQDPFNLSGDTKDDPLGKRGKNDVRGRRLFSQKSCAGGFIGRCATSAVIEDSFSAVPVYGGMRGNDNGASAGGLIATAPRHDFTNDDREIVIRNSYVGGYLARSEQTGTAKAGTYTYSPKSIGIATFSTNGTSGAGGLVGLLDNVNVQGNVTIENCYSTASVASNVNTGGLLGRTSLTSNKDSVNNCYSLGSVYRPRGAKNGGVFANCTSGEEKNLKSIFTNCYAFGAANTDFTEETEEYEHPTWGLCRGKGTGKDDSAIVPFHPTKEYDADTAVDLTYLAKDRIDTTGAANRTMTYAYNTPHVNYPYRPVTRTGYNKENPTGWTKGNGSAWAHYGDWPEVNISDVITIESAHFYWRDPVSNPTADHLLATRTFVKGKQAYVVAPSVVRIAHYKFEGWYYYNENGQPVKLNTDGKYVIIPEDIKTQDGAINIYGLYEIDENSCEVRFTYQDEAGREVHTTQAVTKGLSATQPNPTRSGYTFLGWYTQPNGGGRKYELAEFLHVYEDIDAYAYYKKTTYNPLVVHFKTENGTTVANDYQLSLEDGIDFQQTLELPATDKQPLRVTIDSGNLVCELKAAQRTLRIESANGAGGECTVVFSNDDWKAAYKVIHQFRNTTSGTTTYEAWNKKVPGYSGNSSDSYNVEQTDEGIVGSMVEVQTLSVEGFECTEIPTALIKDNGSTVITVVYNRISYPVTFDLRNGSTRGAIMLPYGVPLVSNLAPNPTRTGLTFNGWTVTNEQGGTYTQYSDYDYSAKTMPAYTVKATANWTGTASFTVLYWQQNADDDNYSFAEAGTGTGTVDRMSNFPPTKTYSHFHLSTTKGGGTGVEQAIVKSDGSAVVNVYYDRDIVKMIFFYKNEPEYTITNPNIIRRPNRYYTYSYNEWRPTNNTSFFKTNSSGYYSFEYNEFLYDTSSYPNGRFSRMSTQYDYKWVEIWTGRYGQSFSNSDSSKTFVWPDTSDRWIEANTTTSSKLGTGMTMLTRFDQSDNPYILFQFDQSDGTMYHYTEKLGQDGTYERTSTARVSKGLTFTVTNKFTGFEAIGYKKSGNLPNELVLSTISYNTATPGSTTFTTVNPSYVFHKRKSYNLVLHSAVGSGDTYQETVKTLNKELKFGENVYNHINAEAFKTANWPTNHPKGLSVQDWCLDPQRASTLPESFTMPDLPDGQDLHLYARWQPFTFTFNLNAPAGKTATMTGTSTLEVYDGQSVGNFDAVMSDGSLTAGYTPSCDGYIFQGWYKDAACTNPYIFSDAVTQDTTVYAKWIPGTRTVVVQHLYVYLDDADGDGNYETLTKKVANDQTYYGVPLYEKQTYSSKGDVTDADGIRYSAKEPATKDVTLSELSDSTVYVTFYYSRTYPADWTYTTRYIMRFVDAESGESIDMTWKEFTGEAHARYKSVNFSDQAVTIPRGFHLTSNQIVNVSDSSPIATFIIEPDTMALGLNDVEGEYNGQAHEVTLEWDHESPQGITISTEYVYDQGTVYDDQGNQHFADLVNDKPVHAGLYPVVVSLKANNGTDAVTFWNSGTCYVVVNPRLASLESSSASWKYDGEQHALGLVTQTGFVEGEGVTITSSAAITDPGTRDNTFTYNFNPNTNQYDYALSVLVGTLTVTNDCGNGLVYSFTGDPDEQGKQHILSIDATTGDEQSENLYHMTDFGLDVPVPWASRAEDIVGVRLSNEIIHIGSNAFAGFTNTEFKTITMPSNVASLGEDAFKDSKIESVLHLDQTSYTYEELAALCPEGKLEKVFAGTPLYDAYLEANPQSPINGQSLNASRPNASNTSVDSQPQSVGGQGDASEKQGESEQTNQDEEQAQEQGEPELTEEQVKAQELNGAFKNLLKDTDVVVTKSALGDYLYYALVHNNDDVIIRNEKNEEVSRVKGVTLMFVARESRKDETIESTKYRVPDYDNPHGTYESGYTVKRAPWAAFSGMGSDGFEYTGYDFRPYITKVVFDDRITGVGNYALSDLTALTKVTLPKDIQRLGTGSFANGGDYGLAEVWPYKPADMTPEQEAGYKAYTATQLAALSRADLVDPSATEEARLAQEQQAAKLSDKDAVYRVFANTPLYKKEFPTT